MGEPAQLAALPEGNTWLKLWFSNITTNTCCELGKPDCVAGVPEPELPEDAMPLPLPDDDSPPEAPEPAEAAELGEVLACAELDAPAPEPHAQRPLSNRANRDTPISFFVVLFRSRAVLIRPR